MKERIYGTEVEFGVSPVDFLKMTDYAFRLIFKHSPLGQAMEDFLAAKRNVSVFLKNEARFYCDTGLHPEYATPETRRPRDCVRWEKAGERILEDAAHAINEGADAWMWRRVGGVTFIKNNCNPFGGGSWGWHQNLLVEREQNFIFLTEMLTPFFVSSYIWDGNGKAHISGDGTFKFFLSQRALVMDNFLGPHTTTERSMISTRDEPHADAYKWRRLHVVAKDSHMSELVIYLDLALLGLIVEMCEAGFLEKGINRLGVPPGESKSSVEREYFQMLHGLNQDLTLRRVFPVGGQDLRALDIQWKYFEAMKSYEKIAGVDHDTKDALDRFEALLNKVEEAVLGDEPEYMLAEECDWAAKFVCIKTDAKSHAYFLNGPASKEIVIAKGGKSFMAKVGSRIQMFDLNFHDVRRDRGLHYILEKEDRRARILDEKEITSAKQNPPKDTRAGWRGWWRKRIEELGLRLSHWDWVSVSAFMPKDYSGPATQGIQRINLDPFASDPKAGKMR